jgi:hypothetical protein
MIIALYGGARDLLEAVIHFAYLMPPHQRAYHKLTELYMADVLNYLGQALTILGLWLNHVTSPIPWPLVVAFLFLPILAAFRTTSCSAAFE